MSCIFQIIDREREESQTMSIKIFIKTCSNQNFNYQGVNVEYLFFDRFMYENGMHTIIVFKMLHTNNSQSSCSQLSSFAISQVYIAILIISTAFEILVLLYNIHCSNWFVYNNYYYYVTQFSFASNYIFLDYLQARFECRAINVNQNNCTEQVFRCYLETSVNNCDSCLLQYSITGKISITFYLSCLLYCMQIYVYHYYRSLATTHAIPC